MEVIFRIPHHGAFDLEISLLELGAVVQPDQVVLVPLLWQKIKLGKPQIVVRNYHNLVDSQYFLLKSLVIRRRGYVGLTKKKQS